ncbi:MAG: DASS family sodium-coupled anion symporter [Ignavibacteriae bacterium]|nr:DASS family sodium-coupled anion symporter [Ignavibacteriota bacterium]
MRKRIGTLLAPVIFVTLLLIPMPSLSSEQHKLAAVIGLTMCLWITEALPLPVTGLLVPTLVILLGIAPASKALAPFADPIMFLFLGAFVLARAINLHGLDKRFAYRVLTLRRVGENPARILFAYGAVCCFISMWISNTATVAMMFPIGLAIIRTLRTNRHGISDRYATAMMLICAFAASIGGLATPIGTPPNLIGLGFIERQLGRHIAFVEWMSFAIPMVIVLFFILFTYLRLFCPAGVSELKGIRAVLRDEYNKLGRFTKGERNTLIAFGCTVILWIAPGIFAMTLGDHHPITKHYSQYVPESIAALTGALLLFLLPIDWKKQQFTIDLKSAFEIDWGVMALFGGGIALGQMAFETKLAESIAQSLTGILPTDGWAPILVLAGIATLTSEFTSNTASANMIVPVVILLGGSSSLQPTIAATMAASLGFMLPISTPTNAIVYSSGYIPLMRMIKYGILLDIIGIIIIFIGTILLIPTQ